MRQRRLDHLAPVVRLLGRPVSERRPEAEWHGRDSKSLQQAAKHFLVEHLPVAEREHERAGASARASEPHPGCPEHAGKAGPVLAVRLHPRRRNGPHVGRRVHLVPWCTAYLGPPRHRQDQGTRTPASRPRPRSTPAPSRPLPPRADAAAPACDSRPRSACRAPGPSRSHGLAERRFIAMAHSITAPMHRADALALRTGPSGPSRARSASGPPARRRSSPRRPPGCRCAGRRGVRGMDGGTGHCISPPPVPPTRAVSRRSFSVDDGLPLPCCATSFACHRLREPPGRELPERPSMRRRGHTPPSCRPDNDLRRPGPEGGTGGGSIRHAVQRQLLWPLGDNYFGRFRCDLDRCREYGDGLTSLWTARAPSTGS